MDAPSLENTIGYFRVSTARQETDGHALERYHEQLRLYGIPEENIYWDVESGGSDTRKGFNAVLDRVRAGARRVVVPCHDRFHRSSLTWEKARQEFVRLKVEFVELDSGSDRPIDIESPSGVLISQMKAAYAEYQRNVNKWQSLQGHKFRRSKKKPMVAQFPYKMVEDRLVFNLDEYKNTGKTYYEIGRELVELFLQEQSLSRTISLMCECYGHERLGTRHHDFPHNHSALRDWLGSKTLRGCVVYFPKNKAKTIEVPDQHPALITLEEGYQIDRILALTKKGRKSGSVNPLPGKIFCTACGSRMICKKSRSGKRQVDYIYCSGAYPAPDKPKLCNRRSSYSLTIQHVIDATIEALVFRARQVAEFGASISTEIAETAEIVELRRQIEAYERMDDPDLEEVIQIKQTKLAQLIAQQMKMIESNQQAINQLQGGASEVEFWAGMTFNQKRIVFAELVDRVECDKGQVSIKLTV